MLIKLSIATGLWKKNQSEEELAGILPNILHSCILHTALFEVLTFPGLI